MQRAQDPEVDDCWCLFDVESPTPHPDLAAAFDLARQYGKVHLAVSNPCFEVWLVLHYEDCTRHESTKAIEARSRRLDGRVGKGIDGEGYVGRRRAAADRARRLADRHTRAGVSLPDDNPSSGMFRLVDALESTAR